MKRALLFITILLLSVSFATAQGLDVHTRTLSNSAGSTACAGTRISINATTNITGVQRYATDTATQWYLYNGSEIPTVNSVCPILSSLVANGSFDTGVLQANISGGIKANAGETWTFLTNKSTAGAYNLKYGTSSDLAVAGNSTFFTYHTGISDTSPTDNYIRNIGGLYYSPFGGGGGGGGNTITLRLNNYVNGTTWTNNVTFANVTGSLTFNYHNITSTGYCVTYTGNGTDTSCTAGSGASQFFNVTNTTSITGDQTVYASTYQGIAQITAYRLFLNTSVTIFNATNQNAYNTTSTGTAYLPIINGTNPVQIGVAGNYTKNTTCTLITPLTTSPCNATDIHDNYYSFNATDVWNNIGINTFYLNVSNDTLGGTLYTANTTTGLINLSLIQEYTYFFQFSTPNATYEYANFSLAANASNQKYTIDVLPAPSIDITIRDADTNALITENITIQLINNITGETNYTTSGGFFYANLTVGTYTIKLESANYTQSVYTVTVNTGNVYYLTAYLQFAPETVIMQYVDSISSSLVLPGVAVTQERVVNGSWQVVSNKVTDITGRTTFRFANDTAYRFTATLSSYDTKQFTLDPILFSSYQIKLTKDSALDFAEDFQSVYLAYSPHQFYNDQQNQVNITFTSPSGVFTYYNYTLNYPGGTKNGSGTNAVGQTFTVDFNITGATVLSTVNLSLTYLGEAGTPRTFNYSNLIIGTPGNTTFIANQDNTYGLGLIERLIIGTLVIVIVAGLVTMGGGALWGGLIGFFIMGIWIYIGFWEWWAVGLSLLVGFALLAGRTD